MPGTVDYTGTLTAARRGRTLQGAVVGELASVDLRETMRRVRFPAWIMAPDGRIVWQNDAGIRLFGDVRGKPYTSLVANVRNDIRAVLRKLGARSRLEAVAKARSQGLIA